MTCGQVSQNPMMKSVLSFFSGHTLYPECPGGKTQYFLQSAIRSCGWKCKDSQGFPRFPGNRKFSHEAQEASPGLHHLPTRDHRGTQGIPTFSIGSLRNSSPSAVNLHGLLLRAAGSAGGNLCFFQGFSRFPGYVFSWPRPRCRTSAETLCFPLFLASFFLGPRFRFLASHRGTPRNVSSFDVIWGGSLLSFSQR